MEYPQSLTPAISCLWISTYSLGNSLARGGYCWEKRYHSGHGQVFVPLFESIVRRGFDF